MKVSYEGYLYATWQDDDFVSAELKGVWTSPINVLMKLKNKRVRVTIEEIKDTSIPIISVMPQMAAV